MGGRLFEIVSATGLFVVASPLSGETWHPGGMAGAEIDRGQCSGDLRVELIPRAGLRLCGASTVLQSCRGHHRECDHAGTLPHRIGRDGGCMMAPQMTAEWGLSAAQLDRFHNEQRGADDEVAA